MLWTMLRQSWRHDRGRKVLATTTIFLAAGLISALLAISITIGDKMSVEMKRYGANIEIKPEGQVNLPYMLKHTLTDMDKDSLLLASELPNIKNIFWRNNIIGFAPYVRGVVTINHGQSEVPIVGTFFDQHLAVPDEPDYHTGNKIISQYWKVQGQWPEDTKQQALVGTALASRMGWHIGDQLTLAGKQHHEQVTITGILTNGSAEEASVIVPLHVGQALLGLAGRVESIKVSALTVPENALSKKARDNLESLDSDEYDLWFCTAFVSSISYQLEKALSNAAVRPVWQVAASEGIVIRKIQSLLFMVTLAAFVAASMGIASLMTNAILQRSKEIGLMKSLGAHNWQVYLLFYAESIVCGLLGGILGCAAGWGLSKVMGYALFGSFIPFHWIIIPLILVISVIMTICGTYFPSRRIAALYPIEVLYGRK
ncbi:ABC transporter permease [Vibrio spartinae]|uniref:ABC transporter permease YtrF n=1 Tax=Vibrio spartinae TaxID=1918945 RepID=A0A1N6M0P9_9VIBR|nr:ABC transporter permease [Vibrio spartinae]QMV15126.1 ABC transporter permease YtrF precursor [Vibrio spartinae]SIO92995.1 ABC transporter permease YtrF precursor [Vibrio spartinae]